jgi:hypothetical protein
MQEQGAPAFTHEEGSAAADVMSEAEEIMFSGGAIYRI